MFLHAVPDHDSHYWKKKLNPDNHCMLINPYGNVRSHRNFLLDFTGFPELFTCSQSVPGQQVWAGNMGFGSVNLGYVYRMREKAES